MDLEISPTGRQQVVSSGEQGGGKPPRLQQERKTNTNPVADKVAVNLSEYILLPRAERTRHIELSTPCVITGKGGAHRGPIARKALLELLEVEDDVPNWVEGRIQICHSCNRHSLNGWCENPQHLSVGTTKENISDIPLEIKRRNGRRASEHGIGAHNSAVRSENDRRRRKTIEMTNVVTGEVLAFEGLAIAARALGLDKRHLSKVCRGERKTHRGYTARYV